MNPETNKFELLGPDTDQNEDPGPADTATLGLLRKMVQQQTLLRPNGEPVPQHWTQFQVGECVVIKNYTFKVAYIGETAILFEPVGIPGIGEK
jgi:hypothetical protein